MYVPAHFAVDEPAELVRFVTLHPLATLVVHDASGLAADHVPMLYLPGQSENVACFVGHVAKANPLHLKAINGINCLAIFHGVQRYISPNWYATKQEHGKAVPTWNYEAVHVSGTLTTIDDDDRLLKILQLLTQQHEATQPSPWSVSDAPAEYIQGLLRAIVGIELSIQNIIGKAKLSQNQPEVNRHSVAENLSHSSDATDQNMARTIQQRTTWVES